MTAMALTVTTPAAAQDVVFRTSIDLVTVDATVLGPGGMPILGLNADAFTLEVDGRRRPLVSVQFISHELFQPATGLAPARHFTSNEFVGTGRTIVVAVDEAHIRRLEGRAATQAAAGFLDTLDPLDMVAVTSVGRVGTLQFSRDRVAQKSRLMTLVGQTDPVFLRFNIGLSEATEIADGGRAKLADVVLRECGRSLSEYTSPARAADESGRGRDACPEQLEQEARASAQHARTQASISVSALQALVASLKPLDGPKTIVLLSEGMVLDPRLSDLSELAALAKDARVSIYVLHLETPTFEASQDRVSPTILRDVQIRGDGLGRLAGATRGAVFRLVGSDPRPFQRIARELSGYYLLGFEAIPSDRDGKVHRVEVSLRGVEGDVRARPAFRMTPVAPSPRMRLEDLTTLLRSSLTSAELPVRVATYTYAEPGSSRLRVVVSTETDPAAGRAADVLLGYVLTNAQGVIAASGAHQSSDGRHSFSTLVGPGAYSLRVAGIDPLGRRGLVQRPFVAAAPARGALHLSDVILAPPASSPSAPLQPIVNRVSGDEMTAYVEVYAGDEQLPPALRVFVDITTEGGAEADSRVADVQRRDERWVIARTTVPLSRLTPGAYVARVRVQDGDREVARATRPFSYEP
jgi:VWFA-related protein